MNVVCNGCGSEYKINPSKVKGPAAWFKCRTCGETITIEQNDSPEQPIIESVPDQLDQLAAQAAETEQDTVPAGEPEPAPAPQPDTIDSDTPQDDIQEALDSSDIKPEPAEVKLVPVPPPKRYIFGLTAKVILLMLLVSLVPGGIYFALSSKASHERILAETHLVGNMVSSQLASQVDEWIDKNVRMLNAMASLPDIRSMNSRDQAVVLKSLQKEYPWIYLAFTTDIKGRNIARSDGRPLKNYAGRQYVSDIAKGSTLAWQNLIGKTSKKPALVLAVPIKDRGGRLVGLLASAMTREAISNNVTNFKLGKTGSSFLVDQTGRAVAHRNNAYVVQQLDMSSHPLISAAANGETDNVEFTDANGKASIGFTRKTGLGWVLAIQQEKSEALEPLIKARFSALVLLGCTLVIVIFIALVSGRALVSPIRELTDAANRISVGDMDVEITTESKDEIGALAEAITRLQDSIKISISRLQRLKK
ncbi:MAG: zinc-ribbon domain-containing protein [Desulfobacterales bacterium]|nr:zinc-ribbon domain-containing protein [Desulfobacterales bacterium]